MKKTTTTTTTVVTVVEESPATGGVLAVFALDKSGSMGYFNSTAAIEGFNGYLEGIQEGVEYLTLGQFNDTLTKTYDMVNPKNVEPLTPRTYQPNGGTALYDAIGRLVKGTEAYLEANPGKVSEVIVTIFTDGEENTSRSWSLSRIKELIAKKEAEGNWTFVFLGSELNTYEQARSMGFSAQNTQRYEASNTKMRMSSLGATTASYSTRGDKMDKNFFSSESAGNVVVDGQLQTLESATLVADNQNTGN